MQNLILFFVKYHALLLFLLLEIISVSMLISHNTFYKAAAFNTSSNVAGKLLNQINETEQYLNLKNINDSLLTQNTRLMEQIANLKMTSNIETPQIDFKNIISLDTSKGQTQYTAYQYISAKVINKSTNKPNNYLTINKGTANGIKPEMAVVSAQGVVGIVKEVSENFATILPIINRFSRINAKIKRNDLQGILTWNTPNINQAILGNIPRNQDVQCGDMVVTSEYSALFPADINIGIVETNDIIDGSNFFSLKVKLFTDFSTLKYVYVIDYLRKNEQEAIETKSNNNE